MRYFLLFIFSVSIHFSSDIQLKAGWNFIGFNENIVIQDDPILSSAKVKVIFTYTNDGRSGYWGAYSSHQAIKNKIREAGVTPITNIYSYEGVWLNANENFTYSQSIVVPQFSLDDNTEMGWSLRSVPDGTSKNVDQINKATMVIVFRDGNWLAKGYGVEAAGYGELSMVQENEAYWIFKTEEQLSGRLIAKIRGTMPLLPGASFGDTSTLLNPHRMNMGLHLAPNKIQRVTQGHRIWDRRTLGPTWKLSTFWGGEVSCGEFLGQVFSFLGS